VLTETTENEMQVTENVARLNRTEKLVFFCKLQEARPPRWENNIKMYCRVCRTKLVQVRSYGSPCGHG